MQYANELDTFVALPGCLTLGCLLNVANDFSDLKVFKVVLWPKLYLPLFMTSCNRASCQYRSIRMTTRLWFICWTGVLTVYVNLRMVSRTSDDFWFGLRRFGIFGKPGCCMGHSQVAAGVYSQTSSNIVAQKQCQNQNCEDHILRILVGYTVYGISQIFFTL